MDNGIALTGQTRVIKANLNTAAARFNTITLRALRRELQRNPEADIIDLVTPGYKKKLQDFKRRETRPIETGTPKCTPTFSDEDIRSRLHATDSSTIQFGLSDELKSLLQNPSSQQLSEAIVNMLSESRVLYEGLCAASVMVFQVNPDIVLKITSQECATEFRSLSYIKEYLPGFPAPKPHGVVRLGSFNLLFTSFISGLTLETVWPKLDDTHKRDLANQLDILFSKLRSLPFPNNMPLGDVQGGGCKDARRGLRVNSEPIMNVEQFEDFVFAGSKTASPLYTGLLRDLMPKSQARCVFTHGDVRPANIMVDMVEDGTWRVVAVIDWESSGFYPEYWECIKVTNNLTSTEHFDWYRYLPESLSPHRYPIPWLVDRIWDQSMANS